MQVRTRLTCKQVSQLRSLRQVEDEALCLALSTPCEFTDRVDATLQDVVRLVLEAGFLDDIVCKATLFNDNDDRWLTTNVELGHEGLQKKTTKLVAQRQ
jgi:hypothetical protein